MMSGEDNTDVLDLKQKEWTGLCQDFLGLVVLNDIDEGNHLYHSV